MRVQFPIFLKILLFFPIVYFQFWSHLQSYQFEKFERSITYRNCMEDVHSICSYQLGHQSQIFASLVRTQICIHNLDHFPRIAVFLQDQDL